MLEIQSERGATVLGVGPRIKKVVGRFETDRANAFREKKLLVKKARVKKPTGREHCPPPQPPREKTQM